MLIQIRVMVSAICSFQSNQKFRSRAATWGQQTFAPCQRHTLPKTNIASEKEHKSILYASLNIYMYFLQCSHVNIKKISQELWINLGSIPLLEVPVAGSIPTGMDDMSSNPPSYCPSTRTRRLATAEDKSFRGAVTPMTGAGIKQVSHQHD